MSALIPNVGPGFMPGLFGDTGSERRQRLSGAMVHEEARHEAGPYEDGGAPEFFRRNGDEALRLARFWIYFF